jgi:hypothetical protein
MVYLKHLAADQDGKRLGPQGVVRDEVDSRHGAEEGYTPKVSDNLKLAAHLDAPKAS